MLRYVNATRENETIPNEVYTLPLLRRNDRGLSMDTNPEMERVTLRIVNITVRHDLLGTRPCRSSYAAPRAARHWADQYWGKHQESSWLPARVPPSASSEFR